MGVVAAETAGGPPDTEALYREHGRAVAKLCRSLLGERTEAEDATQQVFLSAHRALLNGAAPRDPLAWLLAVARNECYARFRQRAVAPLPPEEALAGTTPDAATHVLRAGELASVWDEVGRMPPRQREAFLLREIRGLSYGQLADELSLSPPSVRSLILRARTRLRRRLGDVVAGLGGAPWVQQLLRLVSGADGASPLPSATKAAAVGIGTLALLGGGGLVARQVSRTPAHAAARHRAHARARRGASLGGVAVSARPGLDEHGSRLAPSGGSHESGSDSGRSGSHEGSNDGGRGFSGEGSSGSGRDGSGETTAVTQPTTDGRDGGTSSSTGSGSGSSDGGTSTSGSNSGSDGGAGSTVTVTTSSSGSSDGGSGRSDGGSGSDSVTTSDGG
jgi:RNA polymerase sigma-70 factor (ECF subfamily)